ncbi:MAG: hypothetical protein AMXMBFR34_37610 [Myxococcaceae bacterium]
MKLIVASLSCLVLLAACGGGAKKCSTSAECDVGQSCLQGECRGTIGQGGGTGGGTGQGGGTGGGISFGGGTGQGGGMGQGGGTGQGGGQGGGLIEPDAGVDPTYDGGCGPPMPGNPTIRRLCAPATDNECSGAVDSALGGAGVPGNRLNASSGNGFDDDCDGQVDEGCACPGNGQTKDCYLVPATQVDPGSGVPVGWCSTNAKGSLDCAANGEFASWSGVCRGAQPPSISDTCSSGDFNCDGLDKNNSRQGCDCPNNVNCPTQPITTAPYPNPSAIPVIDGSQWVDAAALGNTTNWTWTVLGGDCDNVLPFPTFAIYSQANSTAANARQGSRTPARLDQSGSQAKYVPDSAAKLIAIRATNYGNGAAGSRVFPAFGLSGDYIVQGEFLLNGQQYTCTQKVQVRAPGIRAELCWDTVGGTSGTQGNDIDLHFARLQGVSCSSQGWDEECISGGGLQDCYYLNASGCVSNSFSGPGWGYADSADSACLGWSSKRNPNGTQGCTNPRLDRDNIRCNRTNADPTSSDFCGPENINLDRPNNGDRFVVGVNHYGNNSGTPNSKPHVNLYCNGERVLSVGYNPATGQTSFPLLTTPGDDRTGDFWTVATIKANVAGGQLTSCDVATIPSRAADTTRDGPGNPGAAICVDHGYSTKAFAETTGQGVAAGSQPMQPTQWCKH